MQIITRSEIGYGPPRSTSAHGTIEGIALHWMGADGMAHNPSVDQVKAKLRQQQATDMNLPVDPYTDISYSFFIDPAGNVYEGRGDAVEQGASNQLNHTTISVCYVGGPGVPFTPAASKAFTEMCQHLAAKFPKLTFIKAHSEFRPGGTTCPGDEIRAFMPKIVLRPTGTSSEQEEDDDMSLIVASPQPPMRTGRTPYVQLNKEGKNVICANGARLVGDEQLPPFGFVWPIPIAGPYTGLAALADGSGIIVTSADFGTAVTKWR